MRRPRAKAFSLVAMTAASAAVAACGLSSAATNTLLAGPSGRPITIGISLPLSGPQQAQGFAPDGQATEKGYQLWASDVNSHGGLLGRPVKLIILNDKGDIPLDKANYQTLITKDHVNLVLAPFSSLLTAAAAAPVTEQHGYVLAAGSAGAPSVYALNDHFLFSTNVPAAQQLLPFAQWLEPPGQPGHPLTAAYPMVNDPFADPPVQTAKKYLQSHGVRTVYYKIYPANVTPRALTADAHAVAQRHPDIVLLGSVAVSTVQAFLKEFVSANATPKYFIASSGPDQGTAFLNAVGTNAAVGALVPNGWFGGYPNALSHVMVQDYIAKFGGTVADINADVAEAYAAGEVEAAAVQATGSLNQKTLANWLHQNTVQTVLGPVAFKLNGQNKDIKQSALIFQWQPGPSGSGAPQFVQVLPPGIGTKPPITWQG
jgi:branched-chain amino acid transport system substrate-binding protein